MNHPAYGVLRRVSPIATVLLENNPSTMTLDGTNTWILQAPGRSGRVVVDPGHALDDHVDVLAELGDVELVLLTHWHPDHSEAAPVLAQRLGAPVRAFDPGLCHAADPIEDGETVRAAGLTLEVVHTPGHTDDSVVLRVDHDDVTHVVTGDTVLGRGTTVLTHLGDYLASLRTLRGLPPGSLGLPGHGPELADLATTAAEYLHHREQRLDQVRQALRRLGDDATPQQVVEVVYADVDRALWAPATESVRAQLDYLRTHG
ncbi:MBL fold metallo-hydrolase [Saccharomonospora xinjiangensis]|uniref:MBL fold metallo-hydrolase n=1 Tax=Saccharomonospora xinjiangensis TaxID=75294 RepID=UPI0010C3028E|nr:MBL fold metallo-hydrolase [Saccharomonospora xinjiangensis]QBQ62344.1 putative polyketide biosynthesis zinc-dependent hydrolase BaeB [Saccharomonospora xinjiangensis]